MASAWSEAVGCWMMSREVVVRGLQDMRMRGRLWSNWSRLDDAHHSEYGVACTLRNHCETSDGSDGF